MTTRDQIVRTALGCNGTCNGKGYDGPNAFSADLSRPAEAWCGDYVTDIYKRAQIPLPSMQPGSRTGFAYCPDAVEYGRKHGATRWSWQAEPGDIVLFDWNGDGVADHTEIVTGYQGRVLFTLRRDQRARYRPAAHDGCTPRKRRAQIEGDGIPGPQTTTPRGLPP